MFVFLKTKRFSKSKGECQQGAGRKVNNGQDLVNIQRVPALRAFWDLENTVLHEICVSGTVVGPLLTQKSPTFKYIKTVLVETVLVVFIQGPL